MNAADRAASPSGPYPHVAPDRRLYALARALYVGTPYAEAWREAGYQTQEAGRMALCRLRKSAGRYIGRECNDTLALRLLFDRERAEADLSIVRRN